MNTRWHPASSSLVKTYRVSALRHGSVLGYYLLALPIASAFLLGALIAPLPLAIKVIWGWPAGVLLVVNGIRLLDRLSVRVVLTPEGIAYCGLGYHLLISWEQVACFGIRTVETEWRLSAPRVPDARERILYRQVAGFWLSTPALVVQASSWSQFLYGWKEADPNFIPLSDCAGYPEAFAGLLEQYAPVARGE